MGLRAYVLRRLSHMAIAWFVFVSLIFVLFRIVPGDPTTVLAGEGINPETRQQLLEAYGVDQPLYVQYFMFMTDLFQLDLGVSYYHGRPVIDIIGFYFLNTVILMGTAFILAYTTGVIFGALLGWYRGTNFERYGIVATLIARSSPEFWTGIVLLIVFVFWLGWFPWGGMGGYGQQWEGYDRYLRLDFLRHLALPALAAAIFYVATPTLLMRNTMIDVIDQDFIEIKRAEGLPKWRILFLHAARNSMMPVVTIASIVVGLAIGGSVVIEVVFNWPGMGREMVRAVQANDYPMAQGTFLLMGTTIIVMNFVADMAYMYLDPRVQYE